MSRHWCVYCLRDPRDGQVRYVGQTDNPERRENDHVQNHSTANKEKHRWVDELKRSGLKPVFEILESFDSFIPLNQSESYWIRKFVGENAKLFNRRGWGLGLSKSDLVTTEELEEVLERLSVIRDELQDFAISLANSGFPPEGTLMFAAVSRLDKCKNLIEIRCEKKRSL